MVPPPDCKDPSKEEFQQLVVGKFLNDRDFEISEIRAWVFTWSTRDVMEVWKGGGPILFLYKEWRGLC